LKRAGALYRGGGSNIPSFPVFVEVLEPNDLVLAASPVTIKRVVPGNAYSVVGLSADGRVIEVASYEGEVIRVVIPLMNAVLDALPAHYMIWFCFRGVTVGKNVNPKTSNEFRFEKNSTISIAEPPQLKLFSFEEITYPRA
jgi:hypothetical protein